MRKIIGLLTLGMIVASQAAVVTYNFNNDTSGYAGADLNGFAGTASDIVLIDGNAPVDLAATSINVGNTASGTITDGTDTFVAMSPGASTDIGVVGDPTATNGSGYLGFTLTPNAGESLDFSGYSYQAQVGSYTTVDTGNQDSRFALWYSIAGGEFIQVGSTFNLNGGGDANAGTQVYQDLSGTQLVTFDQGTETGGLYTWAALDISLDTLGTLATDENIEFRLAVNNQLINGFRFGTVVEDITLNPPAVATPEAPVANNDDYGVRTDLNFTNAAPGVLSNDTDANGDSFTANLLTSPTNGTLVEFLADGSFIYQPNPAFEGIDSFTYEAIDVGGLTGNVATVTLTVSATQELLMNGDLQIGTPTKDKGDSFTCKWWRRQLSSDTAWNTWLTDDSYHWPIGAGNQAFQYSWGVAFTYQYFSALAGENYAFSIENFNSGDTKNRWNAQIRVEWYDASDTLIGGAISVALEDNLTSPSDVWNPLSGNATAPANTAYGRIMLGVKDNGNTAGSYWQSTFIDNASVIGVPGTNNLPCSFISSPYPLRLAAIPESTLYTDTLLNYADDKDGDTLSFTVTSKPDWLTIATDGTMSGTPLFADAGENEMVVTVEDGNGHSDTQTINLLVNGFLQLANLFDNDMVLQRNMPLPVMGIAISNTAVTVAMSTGESVGTTADANGDWSVTLPAMPATTNGAVMLTITSGSRELQVTNVLVGDVWLCSGQSNMDFDLNGADGSAEEIASANYPNLRYVETPATKGTTPWTNLDARAIWQECTPAVAADFSAVAYYFGKSLMLDQNIPIGLINSSKGGSAIESWAPSLSTPGTETLYNSKIHPYTKMPIRGIIWYQGEANIRDGAAYTPKMQALANDWRSVWGTTAAECPLYFVQIAPYNYGGDAIYNLPEIWQAQTAAMKLITNSGMAVINDIGNIANIHPTNKEPVGERLALWAKYGTYGQTTLVHSGPLMSEVNREGNQLRISFDHVGSGLVARDGQPLDWFEIAGTNQVYVSATATVDGNTILVSAPSVAEPEWVRFAWHETAEPNLMNAEGLPAGAFMEHRVRPALFQGELLQNGDFETGTPTSTGEATFFAPPWQRYVNKEYYNSWLTDDSFDPILGSGNQAIEIRWGVTYVFQDFTALGGESYRLSVDVLNPTDANNKWMPQLQVEWYDAQNTPIGSAIVLDQADNATAPIGTWFELGGNAIAPGNATTGRIRLMCLAGTGDVDSYFFDNASVVGSLPGITFENWATEKGAGAPLDDDDLDYVLNLEEYAYNLDPSVADGQIVVPAVGTQGLPYVSFTNAQLQVEYLRRKEAGDLTYNVQISTNLVDWMDIATTASVSIIDAEWERVVENDPMLADNAPTARFIRIQIQKTP